METMRNGVFETNSSSEHSFSIGDRNLRDPKEFPKPDEEGMVHIPWCTYDSLNKIETFTELAQLLILFVVEGLNGRLTDLFSCKNEVREQLVQSILIAYKMVGITGVDGIIIDFPEPATGVEIGGGGYPFLSDVAISSNLELMACSMDGGIKDMGAVCALKYNNTALSLVTAMKQFSQDEDVLYTAALLAMDVKAKISEC